MEPELVFAAESAPAAAAEMRRPVCFRRFEVAEQGPAVSDGRTTPAATRVGHVGVGGDKVLTRQRYETAVSRCAKSPRLFEKERKNIIQEQM